MKTSLLATLLSAGLAVACTLTGAMNEAIVRREALASDASVLSERQPSHPSTSVRENPLTKELTRAEAFVVSTSNVDGGIESKGAEGDGKTEDDEDRENECLVVSC